VRVQKENVSIRRSREKQRRKGVTRDGKKKLLPGSLTSRELSPERQRAGLVARRKALDGVVASCRNAKKRLSFRTAFFNQGLEDKEALGQLATCVRQVGPDP
jgi:hypothetical protein